jgi:heme/copper-type cytochrome/quinol oxidase subunit 2
VALATRLSKPLYLHSRLATEDFFMVLKENGFGDSVKVSHNHYHDSDNNDDNDDIMMMMIMILMIMMMMVMIMMIMIMIDYLKRFSYSSKGEWFWRFSESESLIHLFFLSFLYIYNSLQSLAVCIASQEKLERLLYTYTYMYE